MKWIRNVVLVALAVGVPVLACADDFDKKVADINLLFNKEIQDEIGLKEDQRTKMNKHGDVMRAAVQKLQEEFNKQVKESKTPPKQPVEKINALQQTFHDKVLGELTDQQIKRLRELTLQAAGYPILMNPIVAKRVGLTDAQVQAVRKQFESTAKKAGEAEAKAMAPIEAKYKDRKPKNEEEARALQETVGKEVAEARKKLEPTLKKYREEFIAGIKKIIKAKQFNIFDALMGKKFVR